jgi:hypothetical protein
VPILPLRSSPWASAERRSNLTHEATSRRHGPKIDVIGRPPKADGIRRHQVTPIAEPEPPASDHHGLFVQPSIDPVAGKPAATLPPAGARLAGGASSRRTFIAGSAISLAERVLPHR